LQTEPERNAGLSRRPLQEQKRPAEAGPICYLRIGIAGLVVRHFGIILCRSLTLLAGFLTAALLLIGLLTRRLVLLAGLALVRHGCFLSWEHHNNGSGSAPFRQRLRWCDTARAPEFRFHQTNTQTSPNEQAGTAISKQPLVAWAVGSLLNKQGNSKMSNANPKMSDANQSHSNQNLAHQQNGKEQIDSAIASSDTFPGGFQAIATAYGDYTKKSFEDTKSFVEKLSGAKSFDKVIEIQTEFAKTAYETFVTESQTITALYGDLAQPSYKPFGGFAAKMTSTDR